MLVFWIPLKSKSHGKQFVNFGALYIKVESLYSLYYLIWHLAHILSIFICVFLTASNSFYKISFVFHHKSNLLTPWQCLQFLDSETSFNLLKTSRNTYEKVQLKVSGCDSNTTLKWYFVILSFNWTGLPILFQLFCCGIWNN